MNSALSNCISSFNRYVVLYIVKLVPFLLYNIIVAANVIFDLGIHFIRIQNWKAFPLDKLKRLHSNRVDSNVHNQYPNSMCVLTFNPKQIHTFLVTISHPSSPYYYSTLISGNKPNCILISPKQCQFPTP